MKSKFLFKKKYILSILFFLELNIGKRTSAARERDMKREENEKINTLGLGRKEMSKKIEETTQAQIT